MKYLQSLGIDFVVDLSNEGVIESVKAFLKSKKLKGVDVLYDPVGGKLMKDSMKLLNWGAQNIDHRICQWRNTSNTSQYSTG